MEKIKIGIIGIGNCASSLIQGISYYEDKCEDDVEGLMHWTIYGYKPSDIEVTVAFDIDERKVGKDVSEAIYAKPNCTTVFYPDMEKTGVTVNMGCVLDGVAPHMENYKDDSTFVISNQPEKTKEEIVKILKDSGAEILVNYLPVGSEKAGKFYADCALEAGLAFVNCVPIFIVSDPEYEAKFREKGLPCVGDDIKAQIGATITHRTLANLFKDRGVKLDRTYQLNTGGNTDFLNMLNHDRLASKRESKTEAVQSILAQRLDEDDIHIGPSDYVPWQKDNKLCFLRMEGKTFGDVPMNIELRLSVEDSPNSAGCVIDAIRCAKLGLNRNISGALTSISSYTMKHPPIQYTDDIAHDKVDSFIKGELER